MTTQWEYKIAIYDMETPDGKMSYETKTGIEHLLNAQGDDGWELVAVGSSGTALAAGACFFKRPKSV